MMRKIFGRAWWQAEDIKSMRPSWSQRQCVEWLEENEGRIQSAMVSAGWDAIAALLPAENRSAINDD